MGSGLKYHFCNAKALLGTRLAQMACNRVRQLARVIGIRGSHGSEQREEDEDGEDNDGKLAQNRLASTKLCPLSASLAHVALELIVTKLVVDHASQSNGVTEELQRSDRRTPNHHRGSNEHDVLEDTAQGEDDSRSLANL